MYVLIRKFQVQKNYILLNSDRNIIVLNLKVFKSSHRTETETSLIEKKKLKPSVISNQHYLIASNLSTRFLVSWPRKYDFIDTLYLFTAHIGAN